MSRARGSRRCRRRRSAGCARWRSSREARRSRGEPHPDRARASVRAGRACGLGPDPGVGSSSILVGGTAPLSGEASAAGAVSRGAAAYFAYVNARGGVSGRKIDYKVLDDGYDPSRAVEAVRELVQQDHVFAVFNSLGTSTNLAVRDFLNQSKRATALRRERRDDLGARRRGATRGRSATSRATRPRGSCSRGTC